MTAIAVTIAGSDSGGGAGIQADLKTFSALGVYGASVITALTAQNTLGVQGVFDIPASFVRQQMDSVFMDLSVSAVKIGMLSVPETILAVGEGLAVHLCRNVVLDPVMVAASGDPLLRPEAIAVLRETLLPVADLITPNLPEAAALLDQPVAEGEAAMTRQGEALLALGARAVLIKGGHGTGEESVDLLVTGQGVTRFAGPRIATSNTHGTGCTLSSAIAAGLARGLDMKTAIGQAKTYLGGAIAAADTLSIGAGHGPVHHFHALWAQEGENS
ncbi:MAG: bifunctional hydroxymethylpyrimidine kinase/phosphomethylpyrimidine kinase [Flavobacteriaceae bacterium]